jgi:predicted nucleotidyltransferase
MGKNPSKPCRSPGARWYRGKDIPMRVICRFARDVARKFHPDKIILFGSYAYGTPHDDSDVDILVVIPARSQLGMAARIDNAIDPPFPLDIIVRTPGEMKWRLDERESFLTEVVTRGKVLYEKDNARVGAKGRERLPTRQKARARQRTLS